MDLGALRRGERVFAAAAASLLVISFLPLWGKVDYGNLEDLPLGIDGAQRFSAWNWNSMILKLALAVTIIGLLLLAFRLLSGVKLPLPFGPLLLGTGALATLLLVFAAVQGPTGGGGAFELGDVAVSRGPLLYLGIALGLAMAVGGFLVMAEEKARGISGPEGDGREPPYGTSPF